MKKIQNPIHWSNVDKKSNLLVSLSILKPGRVSAIATHQNYRTCGKSVKRVM